MTAVRRYSGQPHRAGNPQPPFRKKSFGK
jgi:hypothetical protein